MSDNNVTVEKVEEELFKIVKGETVSAAESATGRCGPALMPRLLLRRLEKRSKTYTFDDSHTKKD